MRAFFSIKVQTDKKQLAFNVSASPTKDFKQYNFRIEDVAETDKHFANGASIRYLTANDHFEWIRDNESDKILTAISNEIRRQKLKWRQHV
ncbi:hypothetical protein QTN47_25290 [Danxiaibacter flavus]|uniref:Uncharacterized protein n=1 Tax=Danxiaibacter flavus TaxID=3049108 RepID=A0ABV3ZLY5_9BACT|nr:hypothetical protein QNM32_25295 [Chitinophagaceae bacterium DXS]